MSLVESVFFYGATLRYKQIQQGERQYCSAVLEVPIYGLVLSELTDMSLNILKNYVQRNLLTDALLYGLTIATALKGVHNLYSIWSRPPPPPPTFQFST